MTITDHTHPIDPVRVAHARDRLPTPEATTRLTGLLSMMADPVRLRLIYALDVTEELCVGDLALALDVSEDSVSYALRLLRTAGLLVTRKEGRVVYNRLADDFPAPLRDHCLRQLIALTYAPIEDEDAQHHDHAEHSDHDHSAHDRAKNSSTGPEHHHHDQT
jgi:DNA-binding transcriptional ArsR family regulator